MRREHKFIDPVALREHLDYNPKTGVFTSKVATPRRPAGTTFGPPSPGEYVRISILGVQYAAHRLAWVYVHGTQPDEIDHRNQRKDDNRITILRCGDHRENCQNVTRRPKRK